MPSFVVCEFDETNENKLFKDKEVASGDDNLFGVIQLA